MKTSTGRITATAIVCAACAVLFCAVRCPPYVARNFVTWVSRDLVWYVRDWRYSRLGLAHPLIRDALEFDQARYLYALAAKVTSCLAHVEFTQALPTTAEGFHRWERMSFPHHRHMLDGFLHVNVQRDFTWVPSNRTFTVVMRPWPSLPSVQLDSATLRPAFLCLSSAECVQVAHQLRQCIDSVPMWSIRRYWRVRTCVSQLSYCEPSQDTVNFVAYMAENPNEERHIRDLARDTLSKLQLKRAATALEDRNTDQERVLP